MNNDLIRRQAAINAIENTDCELSSSDWDELTDAIMQVPSEGQQWIPISEGPPKKTGCYTVSLKVGIVTYDFWTGDNWGTFVEVEAWMELPKRYEAED